MVIGIWEHWPRSATGSLGPLARGETARSLLLGSLLGLVGALIGKCHLGHLGHLGRLGK